MPRNKSIRTLIKGSGFSFLGSLFSKATHYIFYLVIARVAGADGFGIFSVALAILSLSESVSVLGLQSGVNRYIAYYQGQEDNLRTRGVIRIAFFVATVSSLVVTAAVLLIEGHLSDYFLDPGTPENVIWLIAFVIPLEALSSVVTGSLRGFKRIDYQVLSQNVSQGILKIVGFLVFYTLGIGFVGSFAFAYAVALLGTVLIGTYFLDYQILSITRGEGKYETRELLAYSLPLMFTGVLSVVVNQTDILLIGFFGVNSDVGIYNIALQTAMILQLGYTSFSSITTPMLSELVGQNDFEELRSILKISNKWVFVLTVPMFTFLIPFSSDVIRLFGTEFREGGIVLLIVGGAMLIKTSLSLTSSLIVSLGHSKIIFLNQFLAAGLNVILNILLIPRYGIRGAAIATAVAYALDGILPAIEVYVWQDIHPLRPDFAYPVLAAVIATVSCSLLLGWLLNIHYLGILLLGVIYLGIYVITLLVIGGLQEEDLYILRAAMGRVGLENCHLEQLSAYLK